MNNMSSAYAEADFVMAMRRMVASWAMEQTYGESPHTLEEAEVGYWKALTEVVVDRWEAPPQELVELALKVIDLAKNAPRP